MKNKKITLDYETYEAVYMYLLGFERIVEKHTKNSTNDILKENGASIVNRIQELLEVLKEAANV